MRQSSIEWLEDKALKGFISPEDFERAKEMHKQEVIDAYNMATRVKYNKAAVALGITTRPIEIDTPEQYYNETYNIKR